MPLDRVPGQPLFDALVDRADGRWGRLRYRPSLVLILLMSLVALVPLAHASPPDPLWITGAYDGDDLDEVVVAVTSLIGVQKIILFVEPVLILRGVVQPSEPSKVPKRLPVSDRLTRSPPAA